jgi:hypothetical protein
MELKELLALKVSYQDHFWSEIKETTLFSVLNEIKGKKHFDYTSFLREFYFKGDKENYGIHKRKLPVVTFCGTYKNERSKEFLDKYNQLIVLDIDKLGREELQRIKQALAKDDHVFSYWESPSKDGIKGLIHLHYDFDILSFGVDNSHKIAFNQIVKYFDDIHDIKLDKSGNDVTRLCFISCDEKLVLKDNIKSFLIDYNPLLAVVKKTRSPRLSIIEKSTSKDKLFNPFGKNNAYNRKTVKDIINFLSKSSLSITHSYEEWIRVAFAISNSFTYDVGIKYFVELCKLDKEKFNENECIALLTNCYQNSRGEISFNSLIHFASDKGFKYKNSYAEST